MDHNNVKLLTVGEAAVLLGLGRSLTYELVLRGDIRSIKVGRARRIPVSALDTFINERLGDQSGEAHSTDTHRDERLGERRSGFLFARANQSDPLER